MDAYIVGGVRTAIGIFNGSLASLNTIDLGSAAIKEVIRRTSIKGTDVDEVIMGNVLQAGLGQNPARQAAIMAGLPENIPAFTVNKVCGSGLKSVGLAGQAVASGEANAIIAGGMVLMGVGLCVPIINLIVLLVFLLRDWPVQRELRALKERFAAALDGTSEPIQCLSCGTTLPGGAIQCTACGWTYQAATDAPSRSHGNI